MTDKGRAPWGGLRPGSCGGLAGCLTFSADGGRLICSASEGGGFLVWEVASLAAAPAAVDALQPRGMASVALASSTAAVASDGWAMEDDEIVLQPVAAAADSMEAADAIVLQPVLLSSGGDATGFDALEAALGHPMSGGGGGGWMMEEASFADAPPPGAVASAGGDAVVAVGSVALVLAPAGGGTRAYRRHTARITALALNEAGTLVASAQPQYIHVWSLAALVPVAVLGGTPPPAAPNAGARALAFGDDGTSLLSLDGGGAGAPSSPRLRLWSWRTAGGAGGAFGPSLPGGVAAVVAPVAEAVAHPSLAVSCAAFAADGGGGVRIASGGAAHLRIWRRVGASLRVEREIYPPPPAAASAALAYAGGIAPPGAPTVASLCAAGGHLFCGTDGGDLVVYRGDAVVRQVSAHTGALTALCALGGGQVASAGADGRLRYWSAAGEAAGGARLAGVLDGLRDGTGRPLPGAPSTAAAPHALSCAGDAGVMVCVGLSAVAVRANGRAMLVAHSVGAAHRRDSVYTRVWCSTVELPNAATLPASGSPNAVRAPRPRAAPTAMWSEPEGEKRTAYCVVGREAPDREQQRRPALRAVQLEALRWR